MEEDNHQGQAYFHGSYHQLHHGNSSQPAPHRWQNQQNPYSPALFEQDPMQGQQSLYSPTHQEHGQEQGDQLSSNNQEDLGINSAHQSPTGSYFTTQMQTGPLHQSWDGQYHGQNYGGISTHPPPGDRQSLMSKAFAPGMHASSPDSNLNAFAGLPWVKRRADAVSDAQFLHASTGTFVYRAQSQETARPPSDLTRIRQPPPQVSTTASSWPLGWQDYQPKGTDPTDPSVGYSPGLAEFSQEMVPFNQSTPSHVLNYLREGLEGGDMTYNYNESDGLSSLKLDQWRCNEKRCHEILFDSQVDLEDHTQKKHSFKCPVELCPRIESFTTQNDLDRHTKAKHGFPQKTPSYVCKGVSCAERKLEKVWTRKDNFTKHVEKAHRSEDVSDLLRRSLVTDELEGVHARLDPEDDANPELYDQHVDGLQAEATNASLSVSSVALGMLPPGAAMAPPVDISRSISAFQQIQNSSGDMSRSFSQPLRNHTAYREPSGTGFQNIARKGHRNSVGVLSTSSSIMARTGSGLKRRAHTIGSSQQTTELITIVTGIMNNPLIELPHDAREALRQSVHAQIEPTRLPKRAKGDASSQSAAFQSGQKFECFACGKVKKRQCDLKKHEKRHTRPWGCLDDRCIKCFGSKNDWKRHMNGTHDMREMYRCGQYGANKIEQCLCTFKHPKDFEAHLRRDHSGLDREYIDRQLYHRKIGDRWNHGFWCGFCRTVVLLVKDGTEGWDERFDHVDMQHFQQGQRIKDWYPIDSDISKGEMPGLESLSESSGGDGYWEVDPGKDMNSLTDEESEYPPEELQHHGERARESPPMSSDDLNPLLAFQHEPVDSRSGGGFEMPLAAQDYQPCGSRSGVLCEWHCCACDEGPMNPEIAPSCMNCQHSSCLACRKETKIVSLDSVYMSMKKGEQPFE